MGTARRDRPGRIGRYVLEDELGRGMMGVVYRARDPVLGRAIALKTIHLAALLSKRQRAAFEQRFLTEARVAAQLQHPGIVVVHDLGRDDESGVLFIALELLAGASLADWIEEGRRQPWQEVLRIVARVAEALHHAHAKGVVHRDVKPANIMMLPSGEPKIMDFGIAKIDASDLTSPGEVFGTPLYMSPEQALGKPVDARSDVFSLGSIAYTLLTGSTPFQAPDVPGILARVAHVDPPLSSERNPDLPTEVDYIAARAMAKDPARRFRTALAMAEDAEDVRAGRPPRHRDEWEPLEGGDATIASPAVRVAPASPTALVAPSRRRRPLRALLLACLAATLLAVGLLRDRDLPGFWIATLRSQPWRDVLVRVLPPPPRSEAPPPGAAIPPPTPVMLPETRLASGQGETGSGVSVPLLPLDPSTSASTTSLTAEPSPSAAPAGAAPLADSVRTPALPTTPPSPAAKSAALAPSTAPARATSRNRTPAPKPTKTALLRVELDHTLPSGSLRVWVDKQRVLNRRLQGRDEPRVLEQLQLLPGRRRVRVEVRWNGHVARGLLTAHLVAGTTRRLEVRVREGRLRLRWK